MNFPTRVQCYVSFFAFSVLWASLVAQRLKRLPAMQENWVQSLGGEDPLEKEMATHSSILAWRIPWTEELGRKEMNFPTRVQCYVSFFSFSFLWETLFPKVT